MSIDLTKEMKTLEAYLNIGGLGNADTDGRYRFAINGAKPTGDYNYEVTIDGYTQENALEYSGDLILVAIER